MNRNLDNMELRHQMALKILVSLNIGNCDYTTARVRLAFQQADEFLKEMEKEIT